MTMDGDNAYIVANYIGGDSLVKGVAIFFETDSSSFKFYDVEGPAGYHVHLARKISQFAGDMYILFASGTNGSGDYFHQHQTLNFDTGRKTTLFVGYDRKMTRSGVDEGTHFFDDEVEGLYYIVLSVNTSGTKFYLYWMLFAGFSLPIFDMDSYEFDVSADPLIFRGFFSNSDGKAMVYALPKTESEY